MRQDRFLAGILIFIGLLVVLAVGLFFLRKGSEQVYGPEETPEGVVRNFVLAVQKADYSRAYSDVAGDAFQATPAQFQVSMSTMAQAIADTGIQIESTQATSPTEASVSLSVVQNSIGLFSSPNRQLQSASLVRQANGWKIRSMPYPFWPYDLPQAAPAKPAATP